MRVFVGIIFVLIFSGCTNIENPSDKNRSEYGAFHGTVLSHGPKPVHFDPNETISVDNLIADRIKGKIKQALPDEDIKVLVTRNRIIVGSSRRENEEIAPQIRKAVGKSSEGRSLVVVTDEVYHLFKNAKNREKKETHSD
jgi:hypothetical protein